MKNYSKEIATALSRFLKEEDWSYYFDDEKGTFNFHAMLRGSIKFILYEIIVNEKDYTVYVISPVSAENDDSVQKQRLAEFVCRANWGLRDGDFELDMRDGELRFKTYVNCDGITLNDRIIHRSIHLPASVMIHYSDGIIRLLNTDLDAESAVSMCEDSPPHKELREDEPEQSELIEDDIIQLFSNITESDGQAADDGETEENVPI